MTRQTRLKRLKLIRPSSNLGNAKIQGMTEDLKMTGVDYNMALFVFFIPVGRSTRYSYTTF